ncbi:DUF4181 domain-containing protein [Bacillus spizizenii]|uniref:DUF4181 domain-containing protein n=1 Tax=Bacillus spizizenii TaxID=96241 RepID=UPI0005CB22FB|nr:DUF4181 domain-containing protein [Bacillus spizizenii]MCY7760940.1 DUF4181 domain-containing protein [Bacillus spizizenii]MCY7795916.1 DUF4181 domain-containing protein [Bacillus spizizenii]MCY7802257.1 DUF4181 domain-containing protein [Bacillus spizizenii]MCY7806498.1 DUF4181 domain-containing protein [Bacillus spizizenii]MCY7810087.1 DUF4181 domain-containing protein [Bacillus spizizenii]
MTGTHFLIVLLVAGFINIAFYIYAWKKLGIPKPPWWYRPVNSTQGLLEIIMLILLGFSVLRFPPEIMLIFFLFLTNCFRTFMEWKYKREEKQYVHYLFGTVLFIVVFIYMCIFF